MSRNMFESAARAEKATRLVNAIDRIAVDKGVDPIGNPAEVIARLRRMPSVWWEAVAEKAHVKVPSDETVKVVIERYQARVEPTARAS